MKRRERRGAKDAEVQAGICDERCLYRQMWDFSLFESMVRVLQKTKHRATVRNNLCSKSRLEIFGGNEETARLYHGGGNSPLMVRVTARRAMLRRCRSGSGGNLTPERIRGDIAPLYETLLTHRVRAWPRLLSRFFFVPVYCSAGFNRETIDALSLGSRLGRRNPTRARFGIYVKPMLYNCSEHEIVFQEALQMWNVGYHDLLTELYGQGAAMAEQYFSGKERMS